MAGATGRYQRLNSLAAFRKGELRVSLGMGCRRDDGFDRVLLSCRQGETGATRTNSGEGRWLENQREQNTRPELFLYRNSTAVWLRKEGGLLLAIQVNTKRRYRAHIGKPFG